MHVSGQTQDNTEFRNQTRHTSNASSTNFWKQPMYPANILQVGRIQSIQDMHKKFLLVVGTTVTGCK